MTKRFVCQHCQTTYPDFDVAHVCSRGPYAPKLKLKKNERIKELIKQATECYSNGQERTFDKEKFAELIVQECADIAQQHNKSPVAAPLAIGYVIREHFGVEE
jgi:hypothetical protein